MLVRVHGQQSCACASYQSLSLSLYMYVNVNNIITHYMPKWKFAHFYNALHEDNRAASHIMIACKHAYRQSYITLRHIMPCQAA